jgi:hypothetical protein
MKRRNKRRAGHAAEVCHTVRFASRGCTYAQVFRCLLCERVRPDEQRREPESEICIKCVEEAGFSDGE